MNIFKKLITSSQPSAGGSISNANTPGGHTLQASITANLAAVRGIIGTSDDIVIKEITSGHTGEADVLIAVIYTDGMVDNQILYESLLKPVMGGLTNPAVFTRPGCVSIAELKNQLVNVGDVKEIYDISQLVHHVLSGNSVILVNGSTVALAAGTIGWKDRGVQEPSAETVIRGPKEGFSETLRTNTSLIRRRIRDPRLRCEQRKIGQVTHTEVALMYVEGIAKDSVLREIRRRLDRINTDAILESGYIEEFIQDQTLTPFPTIYSTERPDVVAAEIIEGRIAILIDGTPFVLIAPALFIQFFHAAEDYYHRSDISSLLRLLRMVSFFIALLGPSFYIAVTTFHQEMLPTQLLIGLAAQREGIPFPAFIEALVMEITFEILREAGVRMPRAVGQAVSIVGALVLGQAAVEAGIVSAVMVIVVSITAISNFIFPAFNMAISIRMLRFPMMALAASFGFYGITLGLLVLVVHLCSLRSFGAPYLTPFAPFRLAGQKDAMLRLPQWLMRRRPAEIADHDNLVRDETPMPDPDQPK